MNARTAARLLVAGLGAAWLAGSAAPALAQRLYGTSDSQLSGPDFKRMHVAAALLYENRPVGAVERWTGPRSRNNGSVRLVRSFQVGGMPCSRLRYDIYFAKSGHTGQSYLLNWCKTVAGEWKIEDRTPPA